MMILGVYSRVLLCNIILAGAISWTIHLVLLMDGFMKEFKPSTGKTSAPVVEAIFARRRRWHNLRKLLNTLPYFRVVQHVHTAEIVTFRLKNSYDSSGETTKGKIQEQDEQHALEIQEKEELFRKSKNEKKHVRLVLALSY